MASNVGFEPTMCNGVDDVTIIGGFKHPTAVCDSPDRRIDKVLKYITLVYVQLRF